MVHTRKADVPMIGNLEQRNPKQRAGEKVEGLRDFPRIHASARRRRSRAY